MTKVDWSAILHTPLPEQMGFMTAWFELRGIHMHAAVAGPADGPLVILLHGFPEFWYSWRHQIRPLAEAGFRVVVPDQRGYNLTVKAPPFDIQTLSDDVLHLVQTLEREQVYLAGHDWGAAVAWAFAGLHPEFVTRLAILNVPHPGVMERVFRRFDLRQWLKSWYIFFFQLPRLPEQMLGRNDYAAMRRMLLTSSRPETFSEADLERYRHAWSQPGALSATIGWYRAFMRSVFSKNWSAVVHRISMPTLVLWGEKDVAVRVELAEQSMEWLEQGHLMRFPEATHWVHEDLPEEVNRQLLEHFTL